MNKIFSFLLLVISLGSLAQSNINWNSGTNISANSFSNMHPRIALDRKGNPLVIWGRMSDESVFFSRWNGSGFSSPLKLNTGGMTIATASWMGPDIAAFGDTVYVVMKQSPEDDTSSHICVVRSFNGGQTFSGPTRVESIGDSISRFPTVTVDATGNPVIAFMKFDPSFGSSRWVVCKSNDYGSSFSNDVKASGWNNATDVCDCCPGSVVSYGNITAMLYRNNQTNIRDTWAGISINNNLNFTKGYNIDTKNWLLMSCPASGPDGLIIGDTLYSVFMNGASNGYRNYFSKASISSMTLKSSTNLTGPISQLSQQNYPRIANHGNAVGIVWKQVVSSSDQLPILFTNDISKGFPTKFDTVDLADITNADIAISDSKVYIVWQDDNSGTVKFRSGTYATATGINENNEDILFTIYPNPVGTEFNLRTNAIEARISITDMLGKEVYSVKTQGTENNIQINTGSWIRGLYFITLQSEKLNSTQKIIIK
jgi:hypothetical protein